MFFLKLNQFKKAQEWILSFVQGLNPKCVCTYLIGIFTALLTELVTTLYQGRWFPKQQMQWHWRRLWGWWSSQDGRQCLRWSQCWRQLRRLKWQRWDNRSKALKKGSGWKLELVVRTKRYLQVSEWIGYYVIRRWWSSSKRKVRTVASVFRIRSGIWHICTFDKRITIK